MKIIPEIVEKHASHTTWRRHIHAHPELAYEEHRTAQFVAEKLSGFGIPIETGIGRTGVVGTIRNGTSDRSIGLRADMDALPMQEHNDFDHRSTNDGVMHGCGHDGHTTMLLAAAEHLSTHRNFDGTVHVIFQPAEEGEAGAKAMIGDGLFERFPVEAVYGMHNWPGHQVGKMATRSGPIMAAMDVFEVKIIGKGGHGALPQLAIDPILIASQLVTQWQSIVSRNINPIEAAVLTVTQIHAGDAWAVIPSEVILRGTVRSFKPATRELLQHRMKQLTASICDGNNCEFEWWYDHRFPPTINSPTETLAAGRAASELLGQSNFDSDVDPSTGSEDFGYMLEEKPGCYIFIGNGPSEGDCLLHNPRYDFNDEIIPIGASYWVELVKQELAVKKAP
ncbi:MAG TPA: amidohydrolase [Gammaproteobacteria bacterium]|nr:amidohydrolase [Gammaproteobacteria bacterium]|tara:strand:+ start:4356 stop:5534 length:1179 start_codon:yes stop_codon:yes gene_type:complete